MLVGTESGIQTARSIKRRPDGTFCFEAEKMLATTATPLDPGKGHETTNRGGMFMELVPQDGELDTAIKHDRERDVPRARRFRINLKISSAMARQTDVQAARRSSTNFRPSITMSDAGHGLNRWLPKIPMGRNGFEKPRSESPRC